MDDQLHDLIGAYAMDALDPDERAAFDQHLTDCADCRNELAGFSDALAELSADYAVQPPPALRDAVLGAVASVAAEAAELEATETPAEPSPLPRRAIEQPAEASDASDSTDEDSSATVTPLSPREKASGRSRWQLLVAAAVVLIAVIGISVWQPWAPRTITAADVLAAPDAVRATQPAEGGGTVTFVRSNQLNKAVLVAQNLPDAPSGKAHQAWLQHPGGTFVSGGMMPNGPNVTVLLEGDARNTVGGGVSIEPPGGSPQPTDVVVVVAL